MVVMQDAVAAGTLSRYLWLPNSSPTSQREIHLERGETIMCKYLSGRRHWARDVMHEEKQTAWLIRSIVADSCCGPSNRGRRALGQALSQHAN